MDFKDLLKKCLIGFLKLIGGEQATGCPPAYFTVKILNWNEDCTWDKAAEMERYIEIKGYENRLGVMVDCIGKEIFAHLFSSPDSHDRKPLTLEEIRYVEKQLLEVLKKKGYEAIISEERLSPTLYDDKS